MTVGIFARIYAYKEMIEKLPLVTHSTLSVYMRIALRNCQVHNVNNESYFSYMVDASRCFTCSTNTVIVCRYTESSTAATSEVTSSHNHLSDCFKTSHSKHITSVKTFITISAFCFLAYVPSSSVMLGFTDQFYVSYFYFISHICNPVIYVAFNKVFRNDVKRLLRIQCYKPSV